MNMAFIESVRSYTIHNASMAVKPALSFVKGIQMELAVISVRTMLEEIVEERRR